jgi:ribosomal protein S18 acetylase RimI-like enzyme
MGYNQLMTIVKPSLNDIPDLLNLWRDQYTYHFNLDPKYYVDNSSQLDKEFEKYLVKAIEEDDPHILIAKDNNEILGFITFEEDSEEYFDAAIKKYGTVIELFVKDNVRHQGVGKALMRAAESHFLSRGLSHIKLSSSSFNDLALSFYHALGYVTRQSVLFRKIDEGVEK